MPHVFLIPVPHVSAGGWGVADDMPLVTVMARLATVDGARHKRMEVRLLGAAKHLCGTH